MRTSNSLFHFSVSWNRNSSGNRAMFHFYSLIQPFSLHMIKHCKITIYHNLFVSYDINKFFNSRLLQLLPSVLPHFPGLSLYLSFDQPYNLLTQLEIQVWHFKPMHPFRIIFKTCLYFTLFLFSFIPLFSREFDSYILCNRKGLSRISVTRSFLRKAPA